MRLRDLYERAVAVGLDHDPRGRDTITRDLGARQKEYDGLKDEDREFFDIETLRHPYTDSRILHGTGEEEVRTVLAGIDIEAAEVLLADRLRERGTAVDAVVSHHPEGRAYARLYDVMRMQSDILSRFGIPISIAEDLMEGRIKEVERKLLPVNHTRPVDAARLLGVPLLCLHTPADNMVATFLQRTFDAEQPYTVGDVIDLLRAIPEYREGARNGAGPGVLIGNPKRKAGRIFVDMTGGTEGSKEIFGSMATSGVNTIVAMHLSEDHRKEAEKQHLNVVIAGHIPSDNLGLNLLFDGIVKTSGEPLEVRECSGFRRIIRLTLPA